MMISIVVEDKGFVMTSLYSSRRVLVVEEDCCNSELDKMCRLLCVKDASDTCLRGHSKNSGLPMTKELCEILIDEVLKVLIQAWWIMDDGYKVFDVECGLLDETLLVWGGEFGRTTYSQGGAGEAAGTAWGGAGGGGGSSFAGGLINANTNGSNSGNGIS